MPLGADNFINKMENKNISFKDMGLGDELCDACELLGWKEPTPIQKEAIPIVLQGQDVIGLAETGSGKTGAFALPILQALLSNPQRNFALILTPTRELAFQIKEQFEELGKEFGLTCCAVVGGVDMNLQSVEISKKPFIYVATPGRLVNHLEKTKNFKLDKIQYLVLDEADRILNLGFEEEVDKILNILPKNRRTMLFSATMTSKVHKLQRAHLNDPVRVEVSSKFQTVDKLQQKMLFIPFDLKHIYLTYVLRQIGRESVIVFCATCRSTLKVALMLRALGLSAIPIYSKMSQSKRIGAISKFKSKDRAILVGTDVISRGLDIPNVDYVINYELPLRSKDYIHRVGRTARAGKAGTAITFVTQYEIELFQRLEHVLGCKMDVHPADEGAALALKDEVSVAERESKIELKEILDEMAKGKKGKKKRKVEEDGDDDTEQSIGNRRKLRKPKSKIFNKKRKY